MTTPTILAIITSLSATVSICSALVAWWSCKSAWKAREGASLHAAKLSLYEHPGCIIGPDICSGNQNLVRVKLEDVREELTIYLHYRRYPYAFGNTETRDYDVDFCVTMGECTDWETRLKAPSWDELVTLIRKEELKSLAEESRQ